MNQTPTGATTHEEGIMKRTTKWVTTLTAVGMISAGGAAVAVANPNVIEIVGHETHAAEVPPPGGDDFVGARFVGADELYVDDQRVGTAGRSCEVVATALDGTAEFQCLVTLRLEDGVITLQALPTLSEAGFEPFEAAVTGGTGRYRHARGSVAITQAGPATLQYQVDLR